MSHTDLFSPHWHRVKDLKPGIPDSVQVSKQVFRGVSCHVMHRNTAVGYHRLDSHAYELIARFDGTVTVGEVWESAQASHGALAPTQPEFMTLLSTLHEADLIVVDRSLDAERLFKRGEAQGRRNARQRISNPLYLRFRLADPDQLLNGLQPRIAPVFTRTALMIWLIGSCVALGQLLPHRDELFEEITSLDLLAPMHLGAFLVVFVVMKLLHELAHATTVKQFGGEVHEVGIAFMVLLPNPYTDASASNFFPSKHQRIMVSAAGIVVELAVASLGALLWTVSDGWLHSLALIMLLTGTVSTLLFNGNPLLKFDGYYVLADWLEIPNLAERSRRYLLYRLKRLLFRSAESEPTVADEGEKRWLVGYGVASTVYRFLLMASIAWMISGQYFLFGVLLAIYVLATLLLVPVWRFATYMYCLPPTARWRSVSVSIGLLASLGGLVFVVPFPHATIADGVVWLPEHAIVRVVHDCEVTEVLTAPGTNVSVDTPLLQCSAPELEEKAIAAATRVAELRAERAGLAIKNPTYYRLLSGQIDTEQAELARIETLLVQQQITSRVEGQFLIEGQQQLPGRHFAQGSIVGYVVPKGQRTIRVSLYQQEIKLIEQTVEPVQVFKLQRTGSSDRFISHVVRQTPRPSRDVISGALTTLGGGRLAATLDGERIVLDRPAFDVELAWPDALPGASIGGRVKVKFIHEASPLIARLVDKVRDALIQRARA